MGDSFGMMEGAFFVSRNELLGWMNDLLKLNLTKIEQLGTGAVYCQIIDACFPGEVAMHKVNWRARHEYEFVGNYKILQQAFAKQKINKAIDVTKLTKAKNQDNLEFGQWMKRFFEIRFGKDAKPDYDAQGRRGLVEPEFSFCERGGRAAPAPSSFESRKKPELKNERGAVPYKKVKLNNENQKVVAPKEADKENFKPVNSSKLQSECDELSNKLKRIEEIVMATQEADESIVKNLRDFLGMSIAPTHVSLPFEEITSLHTQALEMSPSQHEEDDDLLGRVENPMEEMLVEREPETA